MITEYQKHGILEICQELDEHGVMQTGTELASILAVTREVMELTITEEDLEEVTNEDIPAIAGERRDVC